MGFKRVEDEAPADARHDAASKRVPRSLLLPRRDSWDLLAAAIVAVLSVLAVAYLGDGGPLRFLLVIPMLFLVPGYALIQAMPIRSLDRRSRGFHALLGIGISPPFVGLLALSTALLPGGFRPAWIVGAVTVVTLALLAAAWYRRAAGTTLEARPAGVA